MLLHAPRPARTRAGTAPTPLGLHDLSELTRSVAEQVRTGAHDVVLNPHQRWYRRLYADPFVDMHNRMKEALVVLGRIPRAYVRPPLVKITRPEINRIRQGLIDAGLMAVAHGRDAA